MAVEWKEPKTDWAITDRFNYADFNRIKNNLLWLQEKANELYRSFEMEYMGEDMTSYEEYYDVDYFNAFESNLDTINSEIYTQDFGVAQRFFENAPFIQYEELNRIESATLKMRNLLLNQAESRRRIAFRLGTFREVRV